jgi:hypothetical protein
MDVGQKNMSVNQFNKNGYSLIKNAIKSELRDVITQYALFDEMQNFFPESYSDGIGQVPNAHSKYADPAMESMLLHLHNLMEKNTGLTLYPTYSYYRVYRSGDILHPHKDRPSCEISTTVCFNYSYDDFKYTWPIIMDGNKVDMKPGDIVVYRGIDLEHSRDEFTPPSLDDWHVQAFFHYVDANGPHSEYKFDKRKSIGEILSKQKNNNKKYVTYLKN